MFGREVLEFTNKNKPPEAARGWESAADDIGDQVDKWAVSHREEIFKRRGSDGAPTTVVPSAGLWRKIPAR
jgi:GH15 family glucan-1,4-alpha-glucosidase